MADTFDITQYIANFEGFGTPGTKATVNNNPGNLIAGPFSTNHGAVDSDGVFAIFPDASTGMDAANALVAKYANQGSTVSDLITKWAPPDAQGNTPQSTTNYINYVSKALGATPDTKVSATGSSQPSILTDILSSVMVPLATSNTTAKVSSVVSPVVGAVSFLSNPGRLAAFVAGLICIAGAIYLFAPQYSNNVISSVGNGVQGVAAVAAV